MSIESPNRGAKYAAAALTANAINTTRANLRGKMFVNPGSGTGFQTSAPNWKVKQMEITRTAAMFEASVTSNFDLMMR